MTTIESAPVFLAAEGPSGAGIGVSSGGIPLLVSGEADAATNAETQALLRSAASPNLRIVLTVAECYYRIVARRSAGISRLSDLKGKKVGTSLSTSAHYFLSKMARSAGVSETDLTAVAVPLPDMPAAIKRGDVDAIAIWEPQAHNSEQALGADAIVFQDRSVYRELFNLNTTAEVLADPARRRALVAAVARIVTASEQVTSRPPSVWPLVSSKINVPQPTIAAVWSHFRFAGGLPRDLLDVMVEEERWVAGIQKREPRARPAIEQLVDATVLRDAVASLRR
jgi:NitT/TauT family transport system substrate-binding protein